MSLRDRLLRQIEADGPITIADYMRACLLDPEYGYYVTDDPLGMSGDFITAPEVSQMFGELLGLSLAQAWMDQGGGACVLAELGPGRGTLMADMLRAVGTVPGFEPEVHLVEVSPALRAVQAELLAGVDVRWHEQVSTLPQAPLFLVANEFFDALPIRQFVRRGRGWAERRIGVRDGALQFGLTEPAPMDALAHRLSDTGDDDLVEICPSAAAIISEIGERIATHGGAALIIDYGDWKSKGDTFQAVRGHAPCDPLEAPGAADLTAHVDFHALSQAAPCAVSKMTTQGDLLAALGIGARAQKLAERLDDAGNRVALKSHLDAYKRLTDPDEMGTLFKAIGLYPEAAAPPPGCAP
ncbi:MAG: SAM-dependent methyltransferase [Pseudomonadota bacterium]